MGRTESTRPGGQGLTPLGAPGAARSTSPADLPVVARRALPCVPSGPSGSPRGRPSSDQRRGTPPSSRATSRCAPGSSRGRPRRPRPRRSLRTPGTRRRASTRRVHTPALAGVERVALELEAVRVGGPTCFPVHDHPEWLALSGPIQEREVGDREDLRAEEFEGAHLLAGEPVPWLRVASGRDRRQLEEGLEAGADPLDVALAVVPGGS